MKQAIAYMYGEQTLDAVRILLASSNVRLLENVDNTRKLSLVITLQVKFL